METKVGKYLIRTGIFTNDKKTILEDYFGTIFNVLF